MPDDAVKVALEKATEAVMDEMGWKDDGAQDFEPVETAAQVAAAAITNFLRALPEGQVWRPSTHPYMRGRSEPQETLAQLAVAAARAGGGA